MIIDMHVHVLARDFVGEGYWNAWVKISSALSGKPAERVSQRMPEMWDDSGELLIKDMNEAGVDKSVISVIDCGLAKGIGEAKRSVKELNKIYSEIARKHPDRIIAFFGVDPRRKEAPELMEEAIKEWGMRGLKLLPPTGFYPNDKSCYALYKKAEKWGLPVIVHTGPEIIPFYSKYAYPIYLDEVANDFPDLTLIMAHAGFCWWPEALNIAATKPNVYLDLAGWQARAYRRPVEEFYTPLRTILDTIGASKVLFGSDWPALRLMRDGQARWIKAFTSPPDTLEKAGITFTKEEMDAILGGNAARLLKI